MPSFALVALLSLLQASPPAPAADLLDDVRKLTSASTNEGRFEALSELLRARNLPFTVEPFTIDTPIGKEPRTSGRNVVVTIGDGPGLLLVGAHYDAARLADGSLSQGAVDNAASSVLLVRLADALRQNAPPARVRIVWFDMEELGLIGSAKYVEAHAAEPVAGMFNFDVNGYGDTVLFGPSAGAEKQALRDAFLRTCAELRRDCVALPQMPPGDDRSFAKAKIPALSVAILPAAEAHQVWLLMNGQPESGLAQGFVPPVLRTIHTPEDVPAKLDPASMAGVLQFAVALVRTAASGDARVSK